MKEHLTEAREAVSQALAIVNAEGIDYQLQKDLTDILANLDRIIRNLN